MNLRYILTQRNELCQQWLASGNNDSLWKVNWPQPQKGKTHPRTNSVNKVWYTVLIEKGKINWTYCFWSHLMINSNDAGWVLICRAETATNVKWEASRLPSATNNNSVYFIFWLCQCTLHITLSASNCYLSICASCFTVFTAFLGSLWSYHNYSYKLPIVVFFRD